MTNQQQGYFCPSFSAEQYYNEYFTLDKLILDQIEVNENEKQMEEMSKLILTPYQPLEKRGRGRPKGSFKVQSPTTNTGKKTNQRDAASKRNKPRQVCTDMIKIEHRKNFSIITVLNSKRLVINSKKTDPKCLTGLPAIKDKLGGNYGKDGDRRLFEQEQNPNIKTLTINEEKLIFYNLKNNQSAVTNFTNFERAINDPTFKHVNSQQESIAKLSQAKVPSNKVSLHQVYVADNVIDHEQNKFIVVRKEMNQVSKVVVEKPVKDVESHCLLKSKPYYCLTGQEVYDNMDFDSFVYDLEKVNQNVTQINLDYEMNTGSTLADPNQAYQYYEQEQVNQCNPLDQSIQPFDPNQQINPDLLTHLTQHYDLDELERMLYYDLSGRPLIQDLEYLRSTTEEQQQPVVLSNPNLNSSSSSPCSDFSFDQPSPSQFDYNNNQLFY